MLCKNRLTCPFFFGQFLLSCNCVAYVHLWCVRIVQVDVRLCLLLELRFFFKLTLSFVESTRCTSAFEQLRDGFFIVINHTTYELICLV